MQLPSDFLGWVLFLLQKYGVLFLQGTGMTLLISLTGTVIGFLIGLLVAILRTIPTARRASVPVRGLKQLLNLILSIYIEVFRGTPMIVQAMVIYYGAMQVASSGAPRPSRWSPSSSCPSIPARIWRRSSAAASSAWIRARRKPHAPSA